MQNLPCTSLIYLHLSWTNCDFGMILEDNPMWCICVQLWQRYVCMVTLILSTHSMNILGCNNLCRHCRIYLQMNSLPKKLKQIQADNLRLCFNLTILGFTNLWMISEVSCHHLKKICLHNLKHHDIIFFYVRCWVIFSSFHCSQAVPNEPWSYIPEEIRDTFHIYLGNRWMPSSILIWISGQR